MRERRRVERDKVAFQYLVDAGDEVVRRAQLFLVMYTAAKMGEKVDQTSSTAVATKCTVGTSEVYKGRIQ